MMTLSAVIAAVIIAVPKEGAHLPYLEQTYMIGSVTEGETNLVVQGRAVSVFPSGAWVTMVNLVEGANVIEVGGTNRTVHVASRPMPSSGCVSERKYGKLPYAADGLNTNRTRMVVLDPGHGGMDTGALSPHSLPEKDANLRTARAVKVALEKRGFTVLMTRDSDVAVDLYERPKAGVTNAALAFVSIHHNAPPLDKNPLEFRYHATYAWNVIGQALATSINVKMAAALGDGLRNNGVLHANFAVTRNPEIPSCLVEVDFITHPQGELDSWNVKRRELVAEAIASGIDAWANQE